MHKGELFQIFAMLVGVSLVCFSIICKDDKRTKRLGLPSERTDYARSSDF